MHAYVRACARAPRSAPEQRCASDARARARACQTRAARAGRLAIKYAVLYAGCRVLIVALSLNESEAGHA